MGKEQPAAYYDELFADSKTYSLLAKDAPWAPLWRYAASLVTGRTVVDVGCGPAHLSAFFSDKRYIGIDFSEIALKQAANRRKGSNDQFILADLNTLTELPRGDTYIFCEILEHIEGDLALLALVPVGKQVIITVPSFDDPGHVRYFSDLAHALARYECFVTPGNIKAIQSWFIIEGQRNDKTFSGT